jgi:CelD/BcsL family acetyltransferase involved in cellulose biosynthesis
MMDIEILTREPDIEAIGDEWRHLHSRVGRTFYSDYDWFATWWRLIGRTNSSLRPHIIVSRVDGQLAGILPLVVEFRWGLRIMHMACYDAYPSDVLCERQADAFELWQAALHSPHYDFAGLRELSTETMCYPALSSFAHQRDTGDGYVLRSSWTSGAQWIASMPSRINHDPQRRLRRLGERGPVRFHIHESGSPPRVIVENMVKCKKAWAVERGIRHIFAHPNALPFFCEITEIAAARNRLFLSWLSCGEDVIAYDQGFIHRGTLHNFAVTHDPAWSSYSPGILILRNSISQAIDKKLQTFNHGRSLYQYQANYSNEKIQWTEFTFSRSLKGKSIETVFYALRSTKRRIEGQPPRQYECGSSSMSKTRCKGMVGGPGTQKGVVPGGAGRLISYLSVLKKSRGSSVGRATHL